MADAFVQALEKARLTTTGEIRLADGSIVGLASGGQVTIAPNSTKSIPTQIILNAGYFVVSYTKAQSSDWSAR
jgi:hypothetical protein